MTGFARVRRQIAQGEIVFSLKSVNHRGLDLHFHLPNELDPLESRSARHPEGGSRARALADPRRYRTHRDGAAQDS